LKRVYTHNFQERSRGDCSRDRKRLLSQIFLFLCSNYYPTNLVNQNPSAADLTQNQ